MYMVAHFVAVSVSYRLKKKNIWWVGGWVGAEEDQDTCSLPSPQEYRAAGGRVKPTGYLGEI